MSLGPGTSALTPTIVDPPRIPASLATVRQQFDARAARFARHDALVREVGRRMIERFDLMRIDPRCIVDVGCGTSGTRRDLLRRFPRARWIGIDLSPGMLAHGRAATGAARMGLAPLARLRALLERRRSDWLCADAGALPLADNSADLLFSNLMAHWHPLPHTLFPEWKRVLKTDGLLMFSAFGPDTLKELRAAAAGTLAGALPMPFVDMHDFGDMMVAAGFGTPVMDVEVLRLTYATPLELLREARALGGNARADRRRGLESGARARALCAALERQRDDTGRIGLTFEIAYGHAWKPALTRARAHAATAQTTVPLADLRAQLRAPHGSTAARR